MAGPSGRPRGVSGHLDGGLIPWLLGGNPSCEQALCEESQRYQQSGQDPGGVCGRTGTLVGAGERSEEPSGA